MASRRSETPQVRRPERVGGGRGDVEFHFKFDKNIAKIWQKEVCSKLIRVVKVWIGISVRTYWEPAKAILTLRFQKNTGLQCSKYIANLLHCIFIDNYITKFTTRSNIANIAKS